MAAFGNTTAKIYIDHSAAEVALKTLQVSADKLTKKIDEGKLAGKNMAKEISQLKTTEGSIKSVQDQIDKGLKPTFAQASSHVSKLRNELKKLPADTEEFTNKLKELNQAKGTLSEIEQRIKGVSNAQNDLNKGSGLLTKAGVFVASLGANLATQALGSIKQSVTAYFALNSAFENSAASLSSITGATGQDLETLKQAAIDMSTEGASSAQEYLEGMKLIASAQPALLQNRDGLIEVTRAAKLLGEAAGNDLATAATRLTDVMAQFQLSATDATMITDALAAASKYGKAEVNDLADSLLQFGAVARASKVDIFESAALIELLAENGQKGAESGTRLRNILLTLSTAKSLPKEAVEQLKKAGVNMDVLTDSSLSLEERLTEMAKIANNADAMLAVFDKTNIVAAKNILDNVPRYAELNNQVRETGVAAQQAAINTNTLTTKWDRFKNVLASRVLSGENEFLKRLVENMIKLVEPTKTATQQFNELQTQVNKLEKNILPLADRYDELKSKTKLSKDEQVEMKSIISQITAVMPGAATEFDKYGNAIAISTGRVKEFIEMEKARLKVVNQAAIKENQDKLNAVKKDVAFTRKQLDEIAKTGSFTITNTISGGGTMGTGGTTVKRKATQEEIKAVQDLHKAKLEMEKGLQAEIKRLNGDALQDNLDAQADAAAKAAQAAKAAAAAAAGSPGENGNTGIAELSEKEKKAKDEMRKLLDEYKTLSKQINSDLANLLTPEASKKIVAIIKETEKALASYNEIHQKGAITKAQLDAANEMVKQRQQIEIRNLLAEEEKSFAPLNESKTAVNISSLPSQLQDAINSQPPVKVDVPIEFLPQIPKEDEAAVAAAMQKVIGNIKDDTSAAHKLQILTAKNPVEKRDARLKELEDDYAETFKQIEQQRAAVMQGTRSEVDNVLLLQEQEYLGKRKEIQQTFADEATAIVGEALSYAQQIVGVLAQLDQARVSRENAALNRELKNNEARKDGIQKLEKQRVISTQEAKRRLRVIELEEERRKEELEKKQFQRSKKMQIAQALINGALAVTSTLAARPGALDILSLGAFRAINIALAVGVTAAQIATIAAQKFAMGGKVQPLENGKITTESNIPTQPNGDNVLATVRTGEVILNEQQQAALGGPETFRQIGVPGFAGGGAVMQPFWKSRPYKSLNYPLIKQNMQVIRNAQNGMYNKEAAPEDNTALIESIQGSQNVMNAATSAIDNLNLSNKILTDTLSRLIDEGIEANVSLLQLKKAQATYDRIRKDATGH